MRSFTSAILPAIFSALPLVVIAHPISVQLAMNYQNQDVLHYLVSEKYDGIRAYWDGKQLWTRHGNRIKAPKSFTKGFPNQPLDGELWIDFGHFSDMEGLIQQQTSTDKQWQNVHYMVFDLPADKSPFAIRYQHLQKVLTAKSPRHIQLVRQFSVENTQALLNQLDKVVAHHGEGLVLHRKNALYMSGRSGHLLKLKPYKDDEAVVIGYRDGHGKYQGLVGALKVRMADGTTFAIGSGLSDELRVHPPKLGSMITFRYNGMTSHDIPRFARFVRMYHRL
ncbi:DNA ligase [Celerinatantimonas diazotrophica]|uniref:DNA ligase-1 n=1 Tax=Celerinatantimonas diazotrophica TaxID=412034 RepID=A0A4R1J896_9GAMM|nr:DNA ligase [Celerinatantimonas diazotrophica]TCK46680.1 DNA ligase-1 [Celerinatantimonas diazotrophica]CAG9295382.1 DNA ligase [Celerinatantimonas diazotrophica]